MEAAARPLWTAEAFLAADQAGFGPAWRYELVDGRIIARAAPSPAHGAILAGLAAALGSRLRGNPGGCRPEMGSGAAPIQPQSATARIPDATIRCGDLPRVVFEIIPPSELRAWPARDRKRRDLQEIESILEIIEICQDEAAIHVYRREAGGAWSFEAVGGAASILMLRSVALSIPLEEVYEFAMPIELT